MGKEMENGDAPSAEADVDVSAVGTLVWLRRPNGSWWPGRVVTPHEVPDSCPMPPRSPNATPILLLGRRDGPVFVEWFNLERSKRVKPFRCGDTDLEDCIRKAEEQQARRRRDQRACATGTGTGTGGSRYARKEDAVLQALDIERERLRIRSSTPTNTTSKPSHTAAVQPSTRKRRTPNDSEDDAPQRMKDLTDIGAPPKQTTPNADTFTDLNLNRHLPCTSQMKRSKQSHHDSPKRKPSADQEQQPCGVPRKRDRSRPLSELCNGDMWKNGFNPNGQIAPSSLDALLDAKPSSRRSVRTVKTEPVDDGFLGGHDGPVGAHLAARSISKADHLQVHQPCASTKAPTLEHTKRASNCSKDGVPSQCDSRNSKRKTTSSVGHEGGNRTKTSSEREHRGERAAKHKAPSTEVILLEKRVQKSAATADKTAAAPGPSLSAVVPNGLDRVGAVVQQHSESQCRPEAVVQQSKVKREEPAESSISYRPNLENVAAPSGILKLPEHREPVVAMARCHAAVKPVKTLQLNSPSMYNVEIRAQGASSAGGGSSKGGRVPLVSLMSRSSRRPVVGYPVSLDVLDDSAPRPPAPTTDNSHRPSMTNRQVKVEYPSTSNRAANRQVKVEQVEEEAPRRAAASSSSQRARAVRATRAKAKSRRKASDDDESWRPHTKSDDFVAAAAASSPRKMRRLSSLAPGQRGGGGRDKRPAVVPVTLPGVGFGCSGPALACVPLRLVFSRIYEALSYSGK